MLIYKISLLILNVSLLSYLREVHLVSGWVSEFSAQDHGEMLAGPVLSRDWAPAPW